MSKKSRRGSQITKWDRLDNTANLFPVIATESMTNVYRVAVTLKEEIEPELLQQAVEKALPYFDIFQFKLKRGMFWYYFETNHSPVPKVKAENMYPCAYINPYTNNDYLFRVTYYKCRINLEVFHALTDGNGALAFLKEITYCYLRLKYKKLAENLPDSLDAETSLDKEDSYVRNYKKSARKTYQTQKAVIIKGEKLENNGLGVMHGFIDLADIKKVSKSYGVTINQYLIGALTWSIYREYCKGMAGKKPITTSVPVNLRPYFESDTMKNFFVIVSAVFKAQKDDYTFEEVLTVVCESLNKQINKENLEKLFSYNVSNEKNFVLRAIPLFLKNIAMKYVYLASAKANTTTVTNLGIIPISEPYREYIDHFYAIVSMSVGQNIKAAVCSYGDKLVFTFSSNLRDTVVQKGFFRKLSSDGINVSVETNGVYYE